MNYRLLALFLGSFCGISKMTSQDSLVNVSALHGEFSYEIRYATPNNFTAETLYNCAVCMLQPEVLSALLKANDYFCKEGYRIKIYDCYRPLEVQKRMWQKVPRPTYVANPYGKGSIHNKGAAVDVTLETLEGCTVAMGSDYDSFEKAAHIDNYNFSEKILKHRSLLAEGMRKFGFRTVRTEWWHFSDKKNWSYPILNQPLPCDSE